jgi:hypothetical protein
LTRGDSLVAQSFPIASRRVASSRSAFSTTLVFSVCLSVMHHVDLIGLRGHHGVVALLVVAVVV